MLYHTIEHELEYIFIPIRTSFYAREGNSGERKTRQLYDETGHCQDLATNAIFSYAREYE